MNIKQAKFRISNIDNNINDMTGRLDRYKHFPVMVNNKAQDNKAEEEEMMNLASEVIELTKEKIKLEKAVIKASATSGVSYKLAEVKAKRKLLKDATALLAPEKHSFVGEKRTGAVVENIGVVKYETLNKDHIVPFIKELSKEVEKLSNEIDKLNMKVEVEL